jgi:hypothetical protein
MKLSQSEIQRFRERIQDARDQSETQKKYNERFIIKKEFNLSAVIIKCN